MSPLKDLETLSLPAPIPQWPPGQGFGSGTINLGQLQVIKITDLEFIWRYRSTEKKNTCISFYKPKGLLPKDFHCLGHYCQSDSLPLRGYVLAARDLVASLEQERKPALVEPVAFTPVWSSNDSQEECSKREGGYFWLPQPPQGYRSIGFVVTKSPAKPELNEVRCVRADLTETCETHEVIVTAVSETSGVPLFIWRTRNVGKRRLCRTRLAAREDVSIACLKNLDSGLHAMPNADQIQALVRHYGPTLMFHHGEIYLPSSVSWFFNNGAVLCEKGNPISELIHENGSNLPQGGSNDKRFWIDLPCDDQQRSFVKRGNLESSKLYIHIKPALGGTFTDLVFWIFYPFNGPATLKLGFVDVSLISIGQHVCDWEHFTLRISNFSGELYSILRVAISLWIRARGTRSLRRSISAAKYMREWGPKIVYDSREEIERLANRFPRTVGVSIATVLRKLPVELTGEEGPTGPKEKNN
ncbi:unnamed protein product, partial [Thlaspi arvense]